MPFGIYDAVRQAATKKKKPDSAGNKKAAPPDKAVSEITILLTGRTTAALTDFAAGLHADMSPVTNSEGLAFYSQNNETIQEILQRQKKLSAIFLGGNKVQYRLEDSDNSGGKSYSFQLSQAGMPEHCFKIQLLCISIAELLSSGVPNCDMLWILADAPCYEEENDSCRTSFSQMLTYAKEQEIPVYLLAGQFEKFGKIRDSVSGCTIERTVYSFLTEHIHSCFETEGIPIFPVQIYGGLSYQETDDDGTLVFEENHFNGLCIYKSAGCYIPALYALEFLYTGEQEDNEIISKVRKINRIQKAAFFSAGIEIGG